MGGLDGVRKVAVIAPHPDDEVLGCGGTMARLIAQGCEVSVITVTRGQPPHFDEEFVGRIRQESLASHKFLGVANSVFLDLPAARLDQLPLADINGRVSDALERLKPDLLLIPFIGDIHVDHQIAFTSALVWARPRTSTPPARVWAYETLSETNWWAPGITPAFVPNCFVDIRGYLDAKISAFECFESQVKDFPDERSLRTIRALAELRGSAVFREAAEAFMVVREIL